MDEIMGFFGDDADLLAIFLEEAHDLLQVLDAGLVHLESDPSNPEVIQSVFRVAHTLKSSSAAMGLTAVSELTHSMEDVLDGIRNGRLSMTTEVTDMLLSGLDILTNIIQSVEARTPWDVWDVEATSLSEDFRRVAGGPRASGEADWCGESEVHGDLKIHSESSQPAACDLGETPDESDTSHKSAEVTITARFVDGCLMPEIRGSIALRALGSLGQILNSESLPGNLFSISMLTECLDEELVDKTSSIGEVEWVKISRGSAVDAAAPMVIDVSATDADAAVRPGRPTEAITPIAHRTPETAGPSIAALASAAPNTVRVRVDTLDHLMNLVGELVLDRTRLSQLIDSIQAGEAVPDSVLQELDAASQHLTSVVSDIHEDVLQARMLPVKELFKRFPRTVRDMSHSLGKEVDLRITGEEELLDRSVIEKLVEPLMHIIRNALDHGMEMANERVAAGKPRRGTIQLSAWRSESHVLIEVSDDGPGIKTERIKEKAVEMGLITNSQAATMSLKEAQNLIFIAGLSSAKAVTDISGRGVGMDVVKKSLETLGGSIQVDSEEGIGSIFQLKIPLTLAIIRALLVQVGEVEFALPLTAVEETIRIARNMVKTVRGRGLLPWRGHVVPVIMLSEVFPGCGESANRSIGKVPLVVIKYGGQEACLVVDGILGHQEIVVKSLSPFLGEVTGLAGATILGNGRVALIIDLGGMFEDGLLSDSAGVAVIHDDEPLQDEAMMING